MAGIYMARTNMAGTDMAGADMIIGDHWGSLGIIGDDLG